MEAWGGSCSNVINGTGQGGYAGLNGGLNGTLGNHTGGNGGVANSLGGAGGGGSGTNSPSGSCGSGKATCYGPGGGGGSFGGGGGSGGYFWNGGGKNLSFEFSSFLFIWTSLSNPMILFDVMRHYIYAPKLK